MIVKNGELIYFHFSLRDAVGNPVIADAADVGDNMDIWKDGAFHAAVNFTPAVTIAKAIYAGMYKVTIDTSNEIHGIGKYLVRYIDGLVNSYTDGIDWVSEPINVVERIAGASLAEIEDENGMLASAKAAAIAAESAASAAAADASTIAGKLPAGSIGDATAAKQVAIAQAIATLNDIDVDDIKSMLVDGITLEKLLTVVLAALFGNSTYDTATNTWTIKNRSGAAVGTIRYTAEGVRVESTLA